MYKIVQSNGSITIPAKIRASLGISHRDAMEINVQKNGDILLSKCEPRCVFCKGTENVAIRRGVRMCLPCWWKLMGQEEPTDGTEGDEQQPAGDGADQEG